MKNAGDNQETCNVGPLLKAAWPMPSNCRPEDDVTPELISKKVSYYQSTISVLSWIVEFRRGDLAMKVSAITSTMDLHREGYLSAVFQMLSFLKSNQNGMTVFDATEPEIDQTQFLNEDWSATPCGPCNENVPYKFTAPRGVGFSMRAFVGPDHDNDSVARDPRTDFIALLNSAPKFFLF